MTTVSEQFDLSDRFDSQMSFDGVANRAQLQGARRVLVRAISSFFGATLMASSVGLWLVPNDFMDAEMMLIRLVLSLVMFASGAVLMQNGRARTALELEIDPSLAEFRVINRGEDGIGRLSQVISYNDIGQVDMRDGVITLKDHDHVVILSLPIGPVENMDNIEAAFASLGQRAA